MLSVAVAAALKAGFTQVETSAGTRLLLVWHQSWTIPELTSNGWTFEANRPALVCRYQDDYTPVFPLLP